MAWYPGLHRDAGTGPTADHRPLVNVSATGRGVRVDVEWPGLIGALRVKGEGPTLRLEGRRRLGIHLGPTDDAMERGARTIGLPVDFQGPPERVFYRRGILTLVLPVRASQSRWARCIPIPAHATRRIPPGDPPTLPSSAVLPEQRRLGRAPHERQVSLVPGIRPRDLRWWIAQGVIHFSARTTAEPSSRTLHREFDVESIWGPIRRPWGTRGADLVAYWRDGVVEWFARPPNA